MQFKHLQIVVVVTLTLIGKLTYGQVCATPGFDGSTPVGGQVNTYYPPAQNTTLTAGLTSVTLAATPADVVFNGGVNTYSANNKSISVGDLLLIIQMQDATINSANSNLYGAANAAGGPDNLGGTGYTNLGNTGLFEYVVATSAVPLTGGVLTFRGAGINGGVVNTYKNTDNTGSLVQGHSTFQVVRVPQYSNVTLITNIAAPPFNGNVGGIIAFDVAGRMNLNGKTIDASSRGFRAGFGLKATNDGGGVNDNTTYVAASNNALYGGKGEGIVGTPQNTWDGFVLVTSAANIMPNGGAAKGAPGNAGGGGNNHNSGGGGGGNGGNGGRGADGLTFFANATNAGGRPGSIVYTGVPTPTRLMMGGGGGGGQVNDADLGDSGGVGGGIILLNVGTINGTGTISTNGAAGQSTGWCNGQNLPDVNGNFANRTCPTNDGAGGGGAGGSVFLKVSTPDPAANITINAIGGAGGTAASDHGPGGGGGGGLIYYSIGAAGTITNNRNGGAAGTTPGGNRGAVAGEVGQNQIFAIAGLPAYLQGGGSICYPELTTMISQTNASDIRMAGAPVTYTITVSNKAGVGNSGGTIIDVSLPTGVTYQSVTVTYTGGSGGDAAVSVTTNQGTLTKPRFGNFVVAPGGSVVLTLRATINCGASTGTYSNTSAQVYYLDPTRNVNALQRISPSPAIFAFPASLSVSTSYESGGAVSGTNFNGLSSTADDVSVTDGTPVLSSVLNAGVIQSGSVFNYVPTSGFVLPSSIDVLTFSWSRTAISGISNTVGAGVGSISEILINTTLAAIDVGYVYTLNVNGCPINFQTITITVNPSVLTISASPTVVNAGNTSTVSVNLPGSISAATTITLSFIKTGTSISSTHYVGSSLPLSVTIPMGQNGVSFTLNTINTNTIGLSTTLGLTGTLANYIINGTTITIVDVTGDNLSNRVIDIGSGSTTEGLSNTFTVSLTNTIKTNSALTVTIVSDTPFPRNYTANDGRGAQSISGSTSFTVVIPGNSNSVSVTIQTALDGQLSGNVFNLNGTVTALSYTINSGTITVFNKDVLTPTLTILANNTSVGSTIPITVTTTASFTTGGSISISILGGSGSATLSSLNLMPVSGTISLTLTALGAGSITLVAISAGDTNYYEVSTTTVLTISKSTATMQFISVSNNMFLGVSQTISATSTIGLFDNGGGISYTVSSGTGSATINQTTGLLTAIRAGTITVTATLLGNANYNMSATSTVIAIAKITPTLTLVFPSVLAVGSVISVVTSTTAVFSSGGDVIFTIVGGSGSATVSGAGVVTAISFGTVTIQAQSLGDSNYYSATTNTLINIVAGPQTLTITSANSLPVSTTLQAGVTTTASSSSGGTFAYMLIGGSGSATISSSGLIHAIQVGTVTLTISISGDTNYTGTSVTQLLTIVPGTQQVSIIGPSNAAVGHSVAIVTSRNVLASKGGELSFTVSAGSGSATINANSGTLTAIRVGTVVVTVTAMGNTAYYGPVSASLTITVNIGSQSLSVINQPLSLIVGDSISVSITRSVSATLGGALSYVLNPNSASATIDINGSLKGIYVGSFSLTVLALGNTNYYSPISTTVNVIIGRGTPTLSTSSTLLVLTVGSSASLSSLSTPPFVGGVSSTGSISYSVVSGGSNILLDANTGALTAIRTGSVVVRANQAGDNNYYDSVGSSLTLTIGQSTPSLSLSTTTGVITLSVGESITMTAQSILPLGATVLNTGGISYSVVSIGPGSATINANTGILRALSSGQVIVMGVQGPDVNYYSSYVAQLTLTIGAGSQVLSLSSSTGNFTTVVGGNLTATASSNVIGGGAIMYSVLAGSGSATVNATTGLLVATGAGTVTFIAQAAANSNYIAASTSTLVVIGRSTPTLQLLSPLSMTVGAVVTALTQTSVQYSSGGVVTFSIASPGDGLSATVNAITGQMTATRAGIITLRAQSAGDTNYYGVSTTLAVTIGRSTPSISLSSAGTTVVGATLSISSTSIPTGPGGTVVSSGVVTFSVTSSGSGSATINSSTGLLTALSSGIVVVQAVQGPDVNYYASTMGTFTVSIGAGSQTLSLTSTTGSYTTFVEGSLTVTATSSVISGGSISYSLSSVGSGSATLNPVTRVITGYSAGMVLLTAYTAGNSNYGPASITQTILINKGSQTLSLSPSTAMMVVANSVTFTASSSALGSRGGAIIYSISPSTGFATVNSVGYVTALSPGVVTLVAYAQGDSDYNPMQLTRDITILKSSQVLTVTSASTTVIGGSFTLSITTTATLSSGGPRSYFILSTSGGGSAIIDASTGYFVPLSVGSINLVIYANGDTNYESAYILQTITIGKATPVLSLTATSTMLRVGESLSIMGLSTSPSGGVSSTAPIVYQLISGNSLATLDTSTGSLLALGAGQVVVQASQNGDVNYNAPTPVSLTITIGPASQTLTITSAGIMNTDGTLTATAVTSAGIQGGSISFSLIGGSGSATIDPFTNEITGLEGGTVTLTAYISGDANYISASTTQLLTIVTVSLSSSVSSLKEGLSALFTLSLSPTGITYSEPLSFDFSGVTTSSVSGFSFPALVTIPAGATGTTFSGTALNDGVLFNTRLETTNEITSGSGLLVSPISVTIIDSTADNPANLVVRVGSSVIYRSGSEFVRISYPAGISSVEPLTVLLSSSIDNGLVTYSVPGSAVIPIGDNEVLIEVSASNADGRAGIISIGAVASNPIFSTTPGSVTVLNSRIRVIRALSNNGDGINDCLVIENIENFPNRVSIIDRNGVVVFYTESYRNDCSDHSFTGKRNKCSQWTLNDSCNENLPSGPYYYQIEIIDNEKSEKVYNSLELK